MTKRKMRRERSALLEEIAALQEENLRLRRGEAEEIPLPAPTEDAAPGEDEAIRQSSFSRFPLLRGADEEFANALTEGPAAAPERPIAPPQLADHLRRYAAAHFAIYGDRGLYAHFLGAMAASGIVLLRSEDPGRSPLLLCQAIAAAFGQSLAMTTVKPGWTGSADLLGAADPSSKLYHETAFLRTLYTAGYREAPCFAALDHLTAAPPMDYLEGLLPAAAMAHSESLPGLSRRIALADAAWPGDPLLLENGTLPYPENLWLFGNIAPDEPLPDQRLRGAAMEFCLPKLPSKAYLVTLTAPLQMTAYDLRDRFDYAREVFLLPEETLRDYRKTTRYIAEHLDLSLGAQTEQQLMRFGSVCLACGLRPSETLDGFFYHKALRRLESADPAQLRYELPGLRRFMESTFGKRGVPLSMGFLQTLADPKRGEE